MKKILYCLTLLLLTFQANSQTTLFTETFNSGSTNWTLNTSDVGSVAGATGNYWVVNSSYSSLFGTTPSQPMAITGAPQSGYLHIRSSLTANALFLAPADGNKFVKMNTGISTIGYTGVSINFWYLCNGDAIATDAYFGRTYYSIDGGNTWIQNPTTYYQVSTWTQTSISNPAFDNKADLRFAFMWVQNSANEFVASDPAYSVDQIIVSGTSSGGSAPVADFAINNTSICAGQCVQLTSTSTGQVDSYQWITTGGTPSGSTNNTVNVCYNTPGTYNVSLTVSNANGSDTKTVNNAITVSALPTVTVNPSSPSVCIGQSAALQANGASSYTWSPSSGLSNTSGINISANPTITTTYTVVGTNSTGCTGSATVIVSVNALPNISANSASVCIGASASLNASGASSYTWIPSATLNSSTGASVSASPTTSTTYTVTGIGSNGCSANATSVVSVNALPNVSSTSTLSICVGLSGNLNASGAITYTWAPNSGISATTGSIVTVNPSSNTSYTVTGTSAAGCTASSISVVTVNNPPLISVNSVSVCPGSSATLTASGANTYSWSPATGLNSTTGDSVTANVTQTTTYTVTGLSSAGCIGTATSVVTIGNSLNINVNSPVICQGASTILTASGAANYTWTPSTALDQSTGSIVTATPFESITYTVTGFDANGCSGEAISVVAVKPPPTITAFNDSICKGQVATLSVSGANTFTWSPATGLSATSGGSVQANVIINTTYVVTGIDANGCTASEQVIVYVYPETTGTISGLNATYFTNSASSNMSGTPAGGTFSGPGVAGNVFDPAFAGIGTHTITYNFFDANGCPGSASATVTVSFPVSAQTMLNNSVLLTLFPNPSDGNITLNIDAVDHELCSVEIIDITGRRIQQLQSIIKQGKNTLNFHVEQSGLYFFRFVMDEKVEVLKFVVK